MVDEGMEILMIRVYLGQFKMDVGVYDRVFGKKRMVEYRWYSKDGEDYPPEDWYESIVGEVRFRRGEDLRIEKGMFIP